MKKAGSFLRSFLFGLAGDKYRDFMALCLSWHKVSGSLIAQRAFVYRYDKGVLYIAVESSTWLQELVLHKEELLHELAKDSKVALQEIVFFVKKGK